MSLCVGYSLSHGELDTSCLVMSVGRRVGFLGVQCSDLTFLLSSMVVIWYESHKPRMGTLDFFRLLALRLGAHASLKLATQDER